jgi:hypothetical protein
LLDGILAAKLHALAEATRPQDYDNEAQYAAYEQRYTTFLDNLVTTCCKALAEVALGGLFDGAQELDFWVGSTDDNGQIVRDRGARIRQLIAQQGR